MTYSYTQIAQYLRCPRSYRYRYLDGWKEKDSRASLLFGRCFEQALGAYFRREDSAAVLFAEWAKYQDAQLEYSHGDSWERMFRQGVQLLERLAQDHRIEISQPSRNMQTKLMRSLPNGNDFVAYVDAIGKLDGNCRLLEWKTTTSRYPEEPSGLLALDPQLICYSWISGITEVALIAFVRKRFSEIRTSRPPSPTHRGKSSAAWSRRRPVISKLVSSCPTAAFASRKTAASAAHNWGCV
jgi:hypothetical protein